MKTLTAVLFAGGESRRMGRNKATLVLDGEPLWSRQIRTLHELRPEKILISARTQPAWCPSGIETVLDEPPSRGPLSGLVAALKSIETTHLLALAVDLPLMTSAHLNRLWSQACRGSGVIPRGGKYAEPLCAVYPVEGAGVAEAALASKDTSLQDLVRTLCTSGLIRFYDMAGIESRIYRNVNNREQWDILRADH